MPVKRPEFSIKRQRGCRDQTGRLAQAVAASSQDSQPAMLQAMLQAIKKRPFQRCPNGLAGTVFK